MLTSLCATLMLMMTLIMSSLSYAVAAPIVVDSLHSQAIELGPHYQLYVDPQHKITIENVLSQKNVILFSPLPDGKFNLGYRPETHWFKVSLTNPSPHALKQLLEFNFPLLDDLGVYMVNRSSKRILSRYDGGDTQPFNRRVYQHPNFVFPITLPAQTTVDFYFKIKSKGSMTAGATLWNPDIFPEQSRLEYFYISLYLGLIIGLMAYNALLFSSLKEVSYFYYVLFSGSLLFAIGSFNGLWFELLWPNFPLWHNLSIPISFGLTGLFATLFSMSFLKTISSSVLLNSAFSFVALCFALAIISSPFIALNTSAPIIALCGIALAITALSSGIYLSLKGNKIAIIYLIAWGLFMIGLAVFSARNMGWLPDTLWTRYGIVFGSALEMILLAFALALRIDYLSQESHDSQQEKVQDNHHLIYLLQNTERELLHRIKKRSDALDAANQKIELQQQELQQLAHYDPLTELASRALVNDQLTLLVSRCKRDKNKLAVILIDLDDFKNTNAEYGSEVADHLLINVAKSLRQILRKSDVIGRIGGDQFIVLIEITNDDRQPDQVIQKLKKGLPHRVNIDGYSVKLNPSIGTAVYPDDGESMDTLLAIAETHMSADKTLNKTRVST